MNILERLIREQLDLINEYSEKVLKNLYARFKSENSELADDEIKNYIDRFDKLKSTPKITQKDITRYSFTELKKLIDSFPTKGTPEKEINTASVKGEAIYNYNGIEVYLGNDKDHCIKYRRSFQNDTKQPYDWCIARSESNNFFYHYRFSENIRIFYFVINRNLPTSDPTHVVVISVFNNGLFSFTNALNELNNDIVSWDKIVAKVPYLQAIPQSLFEAKPLSSKEEDIFNKTKKRDFNPDLVAYLGSYELAKSYIEIHEYPLTNDQLLTFLRKGYKDLINLYINIGHELANQIIDILPESQLRTYARKGSQLISSGSLKNVSTRRTIVSYLYNYISAEQFSSSYKTVSEGYIDLEDFDYLIKINRTDVLQLIFSCAEFDEDEQPELTDNVELMYAQSGNNYYNLNGSLDELRCELMIKYNVNPELANSEKASYELNESILTKIIKNQLDL